MMGQREFKEEYLTVDELSARIKYSKQSLYNLIHKDSFVLGKHYLKPSPKKILFKWSQIREWMGESPNPDESESLIIEDNKITDYSDLSQVIPKSSINV